MNNLTLSEVTAVQLQAVGIALSNPEAVIGLDMTVRMQQLGVQTAAAAEPSEPGDIHPNAPIDAPVGTAPAGPDEIPPNGPAADQIFGQPTPPPSDPPTPGSLPGPGSPIPPVTHEPDKIDPELDKDGYPWDERIHASTRAKNADGTWRLKPGIDRETLVPQVRAEWDNRNAGVPGAGNAPDAGNQPAPAAAITYQDVMEAVTVAIGEKTHTPQQITTIMKELGAANTVELQDKPELWSKLHERLTGGPGNAAA